MSIESANYIAQLDPTNPKGTDKYDTADNHERLTKKAFYQTLPNLDSEVSANPQELNAVVGLQSSVLSAFSTLESNLNNELLGISETAAATLQWGGSLKYVQTATPTVAANSFWFQL